MNAVKRLQKSLPLMDGAATAATLSLYFSCLFVRESSSRSTVCVEIPGCAGPRLKSRIVSTLLLSRLPHLQ
jgi:hypothetical protein